MSSLNKLWFWIPAVLLAVAVLPLPYGYYQFLRLVIAIASGVIAVSAYKSNNEGWAFAFGAICMLFNPIFPIHLDKELWIPIDLVCAGVFFAAFKIGAKRGGS